MSTQRFSAGDPRLWVAAFIALLVGISAFVERDSWPIAALIVLVLMLLAGNAGFIFDLRRRLLDCEKKHVEQDRRADNLVTAVAILHGTLTRQSPGDRRAPINLPPLSKLLKGDIDALLEYAPQAAPVIQAVKQDRAA